jgi:hypothetical protein
MDLVDQQFVFVFVHKKKNKLCVSFRLLLLTHRCRLHMNEVLNV